MANQEHLQLLKQGKDTWHKWRLEHQGIQPDLNGADLSETNLRGTYLKGADLSGADLKKAKLEGANLSSAILTGANLSSAFLNDAYLKGADLSGANLIEARLIGTYLGNAKLIGVDLSRAYLHETNLTGADLSNTNLRKADLRGANLSGANICGANLQEANLYGAILYKADLSRANLYEATLCGATFVETNLTAAILTNCSVYGISVWKAELQDTMQDNLVITPDNEPTITVDNLEVAQFIYLLLNNKKIREVIDTIASKVVLILGRFTPRRKVILDALKEELRKQNYSPVVFDFDKPESRDFTETARTLAHMSRIILADITEPSSVPQELQAIVPDLEVPVQPLLEEGEKQYAIFPDLRKYSWVFPVYHYKDQASLIASLKKEIIEPADKKARELAVEKARRLERP